MQKLCAERAVHTVAAGATSLLHTAALGLVSPGGQVLENCLWSKAEREFHCSLAGLFLITPISAFSPGQPGWVFLVCICASGKFWTNSK